MDWQSNAGRAKVRTNVRISGRLTMLRITILVASTALLASTALAQ